MAFIPAVDTVRVSMQYEDGYANQLMNIYHCTKPGGYTLADFVTLATTFQTWDSSSLAPNRNVGIQLTQITVLGLTLPDGLVYETSILPPTPGTLTGVLLPGNVTLAIKWSTGFSGRSHRGRTYHIGLEDTQVLTNQMLPMATTALQTAYTALIGVVTGAGWTLVICSYFHDRAPRTTAVLTPVTSASINPDLDSQRRRLNTRGR